MDAKPRTKVELSGTQTTRSQDPLLDAVFTLGLFVLQRLLKNAGIHWTLVRFMFWGIIGASVWVSLKGKWAMLSLREMKKSALSVFLLYVRCLALLVALSTLPTSRVVLIAQGSRLLGNAIIRPQSVLHVFICGFGLLLSLCMDVALSGIELGLAFGCYTALLVESLSGTLLDTIQDDSGLVHNKPMGSLATLVGSFVLSGVVYISQGQASLPGVSELSFVVLTPILAVPFLRLSPAFTGTTASPADRYIKSLLIVWFTSCGVNLLANNTSLLSSWKDLPLIGCLWYGLHSQDRISHRSPYPTIWKVCQGYLHSILGNPESRKIFYFLVLNMCYMLVQMLYGIWTNSLGLISDAIHMAFDCMAIGIGLIASVMARWPPNEKFTFGYGRIETLSGFSNGIFLILISIFIVFEAVQRLLNPPDMNTSQLLLVSSLGLAVNLFGMFAMGGHHHGGHSHTHSHSQSHSHAHAHSHSVEHEILESHASLKDNYLHAHGEKIEDDLTSPITPSYHFEHDDHLQHHHSVEDSHGHLHAQSEGHSHNMRGIFLHILADTLGSVGVIISTLLIQFYGWTGFDPIASLFIALLIAASVVPLIADTAKILALDLSFATSSVDVAMSKLAQMPEISQFSLFLWPKNDAAITGSLQVQANSDFWISVATGHPSRRVSLVAEFIEEIFSSIKGLEKFNIQMN